MIGAIAGDMLGAPYEAAAPKRKSFDLYHWWSRPTDDSILTLAVAEALLKSDGAPAQNDFAARLRMWGRRYPGAGYGGTFRRWMESETMGPYNSWGNGSAMRASPTGWAGRTVEEVLSLAELSASPTHNHPEGIKGAQAVALAVFMARQGADREDIRREVENRFAYDLDRTINEIRPGYRFQVSCQGSVPEAIIAFLDSEDFEDAVRNAVSLGGDADTQACISAAIAEAYYGLPESMLSWIVPRLDTHQLRVMDSFYSRFIGDSPAPRIIELLAADRWHSDEIMRPIQREPRYRFTIHEQTWARLTNYAERIENGAVTPGRRLAAELEAIDRADAEAQDAPGVLPPKLFDALVNSKPPRIFAEHEVTGDGSDWSPEELGILGDIGVAVPVTVYDDGRHRDPSVHRRPFPATLLYIPGALLRSGSAVQPADWTEVVDSEAAKGGAIDQDRFTALYERRLLPALRYASLNAEARGRQALVTIPGLGCGQFAGPFRGHLGDHLRTAVGEILARYQAQLGGVRAVWFDPYDECSPERSEIGSISYLVRPLLQTGPQLPQLCPPEAYEEAGDDFSDCDLYSVVAWDHVSWPGNDFYAGQRATDDGVKAAATDSMYQITGFAGFYDPVRYAYVLPDNAGTWGHLVGAKRLRLQTRDNVLIVGSGKDGR